MIFSRRAFTNQPREALAQLFTRCFENYLVDVSLDSEGLGKMIRLDGVDHASSIVVRADGEDSAIAMIAQRGDESRLAAMGVVRAMRGKGVGRWTVEQLLYDAHARGDATMTLEVIEQNKPAVALYTSTGFERTRRLVGYYATSDDLQPEEAELEWAQPEAVRNAMDEHGPLYLPWQMSSDRMPQYRKPNLTVRLGPALAIYSNPELDAILLHPLWVDPRRRRQGWGSRMVRSLAAKYPDRTWRVRAVVPEDLAPHFFESCGFRRLDLTQLEMIRRFL